MDWEEAAVAVRLRATIGMRLAGTAEELLMDDCFIWFSCSELTPVGRSVEGYASPTKTPWTASELAQNSPPGPFFGQHDYAAKQTRLRTGVWENASGAIKFPPNQDKSSTLQDDDWKR